MNQEFFQDVILGTCFVVAFVSACLGVVVEFEMRRFIPKQERRLFNYGNLVEKYVWNAEVTKGVRQKYFLSRLGLSTSFFIIGAFSFFLKPSLPVFLFSLFGLYILLQTLSNFRRYRRLAS